MLNSAVGIIKANKNARFIFAGSGPEFGQLQQMVNKLGLNDYVFITGVTFNEEMKNALLINADLVILASVKSKK
ncbi:glycosyltransferase family 4 protein [Escherichia coli]|nr:glycosyltransferase family 4 protein [Escherichia coli]